MQTKEEATVYVKEFDLFVTVGLLEDTPAVLSLGKLCEDQGYSYEWTNGQKPQLMKDGRRIKVRVTSSAVRVSPSHEPAETQNTTNMQAMRPYGETL